MEWVSLTSCSRQADPKPRSDVYSWAGGDDRRGDRGDSHVGVSPSQRGVVEHLHLLNLRLLHSSIIVTQVLARIQHGNTQVLGRAPPRRGHARLGISKQFIVSARSGSASQALLTLIIAEQNIR
jgi:hypothetical protein